MPIPEIEQFAELLIRTVRDEAIRQCDSTLQPHAPSPVAVRWRAARGQADLTTLAREVVPDVVDDTVCALLRAIDDGALRLLFTAANGKTIDLPADGLGELVGWYMGTGGWRAQYSKERFVDDLADLA
jgi:hypothetical protein